MYKQYGLVDSLLYQNFPGQIVYKTSPSSSHNSKHVTNCSVVYSYFCSTLAGFILLCQIVQ